jgi:hypothetical protein
MGKNDRLSLWLFFQISVFWKSATSEGGTKDEYLRYEKFPFLNQNSSDFSYGMVVKIMHEVTEIFFLSPNGPT